MKVIKSLCLPEQSLTVVVAVRVQAGPVVLMVRPN